ncbi:5,10-methylenetetrahydrofolate reductase [uncultured Rubrobacteraceae bacterium]|uniref:Methylenetetrahydrofolate reductase n=1 Tax=uncultured Rubrobacteraceae bacterium TaxID=349277 RepID=A0A6J4PZZ2_9ACTN|nr:5,10-methylenetetrahydrofolate reductase [uncultured Rubrobacteraceae bacterium]
MTDSEILSRPRFEILPTEGAEERAGHLPRDGKVAVTCSPGKGIENTLRFSERLLQRGFRVVPHIAARLVGGRAHLEEILRWFDEHGLREIYVIGGDSKEPVGPYASALELLDAMSRLEHGVEEVGIGGYPEGHPLIDDEELDRALLDKQPFASYVVTQLCFDADTILRWISGIRHKGIRLPVYVGLPGAVDPKKLLRVSLKVGVGDSVRFLKKQTGLVGMLLKPGGYSPDELVERLAPYAGDEHYDIVGLHLYTFNQVESTVQWRQRMLGPQKTSGTGAPR